MNDKIRKIYTEELDLWKEVTKDDLKFKGYISEKKTERSSTVIIKKDRDKDKSFINHSNLSNEKTNTNKQYIDKIPQANKSMVLKLKRGHFAIESVLDLHGYTKNQAHLIMSRFIKESVSNNLRCILVITGKKNSYFGASSVLRKHLPAWLEEEGLSHLILAHCFATSKDGGDGARYILLRKKEKV